ncbi:hypothetical protein MASR1M45_28440 [Candidatus Kapaibacterium sp.]
MIQICKWRILKENIVSRNLSHIYPYWKYIQIQRPTKRHNQQLTTLIRFFRYDDPIWDLTYSPSGFGCKCSVTPIKDGSNAEEGSNI